MTRETYIKVANAVRKQLRKNQCQIARLHIIEAAGNFAALAHADNPRFSFEKFRKACGIGEI